MRTPVVGIDPDRGFKLPLGPGQIPVEGESRSQVEPYCRIVRCQLAGAAERLYRLRIGVALHEDDSEHVEARGVIGRQQILGPVGRIQRGAILLRCRACPRKVQAEIGAGRVHRHGVLQMILRSARIAQFKRCNASD